MGLILIEPPGEEPVTTAAAVAHVRAPSVDESLVAAMAVAARELCEAYTHRAFIEQTWRLTLPEFPRGGGAILLPRPNLMEVIAVSYIDNDGETVTMPAADYEFDVSSLPGLVRSAYRTEWPEGRSVVVEYTAGYESADAVPQSIKSAILLVTSDLYHNREARFVGTIQTDNPAVRSLLAAHVYREAA
jgi:uncharacterized phiE125 gp8 family phage protein